MRVKTLKGTSVSYENNLRQLEEQIRYLQDSERAIYVDGYGNVLMDSAKNGSKTDPHHVYVDNNEEWGLLSMVAMHSHPTFTWGDYYWGSTFSSDDIYTGMKNNFKEIRFCDKYYTGILRRDGKYWRNDWGTRWTDAVADKISKELRKYQLKYREKMIEGKMKVSDYLANYCHYAMEDFSCKHGLDYRRELRHPLPSIPDFKKTLGEKELKAYPKMWLE